MRTDCIWCGENILPTWPGSICSDCHEDRLNEVEIEDEKEKSYFDIYREENNRNTL